MKETNKNEVIVLSVVEGGLSVTEAATRFGVSRQWVHTLLARYRSEGLKGVQPRSRRPHTNPNQTSQTIMDEILRLRENLDSQGLDSGPESIWDRLDPATRPAVSTIWRILKAAGKITPQPQKRPRSSWHRFAAAAPNETWQSDFTHWQTTDHEDVEIISWLDDHSRYLLHISVYPRVSLNEVITTFTTTCKKHGYPASTLTDNGMVYTTRLARGADGSHSQPNGFEQLIHDLNITQKNGSPGHPTTQGKIERYHQTLKKWLKAQNQAPTIPDLQKQLNSFARIYNTERPHRAIGRKTPNTAYNALPKAEPTKELFNQIWRVRHDKVDSAGHTTLRHSGKLLHLGIGRAHKHQPILILIHANNTIVINRDTGEIIAEHTLNPTKKYQPKNR